MAKKSQKKEPISAGEFWYNVGAKVRRVWHDLNDGNQEKKDIEGKKIVGIDGKPIKDKENADNYAHSITDAKIAQRGADEALIAGTIGVLKEGYDVVTKVFRGDNVKQVFKDGYKDMKNNLRGLKWGLQNPNGDAEKYFAQLDLKKNEIVEGHNNGIADGKRAMALAMRQEYQLAQSKVDVAKAEQSARARIEQAKGTGVSYGVAPKTDKKSAPRKSQKATNYTAPKQATR